MMTTTVLSSCHWKTVATLCLRKKRPEKALLTLTVNYRRIVKTNYAIQNNSKLSI